ncbi:unnamed protein product, partial [Amoebophrya sp. A120]
VKTPARTKRDWLAQLGMDKVKELLLSKGPLGILRRSTTIPMLPVTTSLLPRSDFFVRTATEEQQRRDFYSEIENVEQRRGQIIKQAEMSVVKDAEPIAGAQQQDQHLRTPSKKPPRRYHANNPNQDQPMDEFPDLQLPARSRERRG